VSSLIPRLAILLFSGCAAAHCPEPATVEPPGAQGPGESAKHHGQGGHRHDPLVRRFEDASTWAARFEGPERDAYQKPGEVVRAMAIEEGMNVADIGAGTGYFLPHLAPAVGASGRVEAIDIEPTMVRYMIDRAERDGLGNVSPRLGAVDDPLLRPASLDRILIVNTWHHIPDRVAYAEKLAEALVAGGQVFIVDFELDSPRGPGRDHKIAPENAAADLEAAGLKVRVDRDLLPDQYLAIGEKVLEGG
jgi:SAM-dependent methyltransferase